MFVRTSEWLVNCRGRPRSMIPTPRSVYPRNDFLAVAKGPLVGCAGFPCYTDTLQTPGALLLVLLFLMPFSFLRADQPIQIIALTNSADFQPGLPQKGSLASIFCTGLQGGPASSL